MGAEVTVLLVEDDARLQILGRKVLERHGYQVVLADNGRSAVALAGEQVNLVLMDVSLPEMDGLAATRLIKAAHPDLPIVALTAHAMSGDRERSLSAGCDGFLSKPYQIPDLVRTVADFARAS